jgi:hypothetical protein
LDGPLEKGRYVQKRALPPTWWALIAFILALLAVLFVAVLLGGGPTIPA